MVTEQDATVSEAGEKVRNRGLLFELENVAVNGRQMEYDALQSALKSQRIDLAPALFSRYCLNKRVEAYMPALLGAIGKKESAADALIEAVTGTLQAAYSDGKLTLNGALESLLKKAHKHRCAIGAISSLDAALAAQLSRSLGLEDMDVVLRTLPPDDAPCPANEDWVHLAKAIERSPGRCVAIGTSRAACRGALTARMRFIGLPDAFTEFQDFTGADLVLSALDAGAVAEMLAPVE